MGQIIFVTSDAVVNFHFLWFYGDIGIYFENKDGDTKKNYFISLSKQDGTATFWGTNDLTNSIFFNKVKAGKYRVYLASKAINETDYQPVRCPGGELYYNLTIANDGTTSLSEAEYMRDDLFTNIKAPHFVVQTSDNIYDLSGRKINSSIFTLHSSLKHKGIYIKGGKKVVVN
ncbi:MAG: hypothetical protein J6W21_08265 [Bacteroidaceae bacterium]|nr:hypothetical protein [Bacteroidaceae bacterium]